MRTTSMSNWKSQEGGQPNSTRESVPLYVTFVTKTGVAIWKVVQSASEENTWSKKV
ncbi:hypothetical protein Mapa_015765 [Marchantia paleacea]|nr:hypothetical protein Mapa_015765 [Marchantia paleacea]